MNDHSDNVNDPFVTPTKNNLNEEKKSKYFNKNTEDTNLHINFETNFTQKNLAFESPINNIKSKKIDFSKELLLRAPSKKPHMIKVDFYGDSGKINIDKIGIGPKDIVSNISKEMKEEFFSPIRSTLKNQNCTKVYNTQIRDENSDKYQKNNVLSNICSMENIGNSTNQKSDNHNLIRSISKESIKRSQNNFIQSINQAAQGNNLDIYNDTEIIVTNLKQIILQTSLFSKYDNLADFFVIFPDILNERIYLENILLNNLPILEKIRDKLFLHFFKGFNERTDIFNEYLDENVTLEILDFPLDTFQNNLTLIKNHILNFIPNNENKSMDFDTNTNKFIFSVNGVTELNTDNKDKLTFILSLRLKISNSRLKDISYLDVITKMINDERNNENIQFGMGVIKTYLSSSTNNVHFGDYNTQFKLLFSIEYIKLKVG